MKATTIDLLRHGLPEGGEIFRGSTDVPLTEKGWQQMRATTHAFITDEMKVPWDRIVHSPLDRCKVFAQALSGKVVIPAVEHESFREIHFGDWDGKLVSDVEVHSKELVRQYWQDPVTYSPPNGETMVDFSARLETAWNQILQDYAGEHILLVIHGGVMRVLLAQVLGMPLSAVSRFEIPYACLSRVKIYQKEGFEPWPQLVFHGGGHLQEKVTNWYSAKP